MALLILAAAAPVAAAEQSDCSAGPAAGTAANRVFIATLAWSPFGRVETGWATYAPLIAREIGTRCAPLTPGFAAALARWQQRHRLPADGIVTAASFAPMRDVWQARRPYVALRGRGVCPPPPDQVVSAALREGYLGKPVLLRARALGAYRNMVVAARRDLPGLRRDPRWLSIFSGYRDPAADAARCASEGNCQGVTRAKCSAHRTGLALDMYVGQAPGFGPDSSADVNRRAMTQSAAYLWLIANAARFGFVNYPFEPWHWEWTGERP